MSERPKRTRLRKAGQSQGPRLAEAAVEALEAAIGYRFRHRDNLDRAMTHVSAVHGKAADTRFSNQRLEFLGDRVLGLVIAETLYERFGALREGGLAPRLNALVNGKTCAEVCRRAGLQQYLILGSGERENGTASRESVQADVCEAVIAALYRDGGLKAAKAFIDRYWAREIQELSDRPVDAKTQLQMRVQAMGYDLPRYRTLDRTGPDHAPVFEVEVLVDGLGTASGTARNKQAAEQEAAARLLKETGIDIEADT